MSYTRESLYMEKKVYAPMLIPTFCRDQHFMRCIESLKKNTWAKYTDVYIWLDYPLLATKNGGSEEILEDGRFGELIENTGDVSTLSANVLGAVNNVKDLKSKALSAQSHFSMAKVLSEYTRLIDKVSVDRNTLKNE